MIGSLGRAIGRLVLFLLEGPKEDRPGVIDVEGEAVSEETAPRTRVYELPPPARAVCPCGSGKKFDECHGRKR